MSSFFDILSNFIENVAERKNEVTEDLKDIDITTDEGYGEYMKFLGDLRVRSEKYNDVFKMLFGENVSELIDRVAKEATDEYTKAKEEREAEAKKAETARIEAEAKKKREELVKRNEAFLKQKEAEKTTASKPKFDIKEDHCSCCGISVPSDNVDDDVYESICNVVDKYMAKHVAPYIESSDECAEIEAELVEFACWLKSSME